MKRTIDTYNLSNNTLMRISPDWGCNLFSWQIDGEEIIYCPEGYPDAAWKITDGGSPLLFPAVGRTWDTSSGDAVAGVYRIAGVDGVYNMPSHGILYFCDWKRLNVAKSDDSVTVAYEAAVPQKVRDESYPFDTAFMQSYTLKESSVTLKTVVTNNGERPAPAAFGLHPYFLISNPEREGVEARMSVRKHLFVTKKTVELTGEYEETDGVLSLKPDVYYDDVYGESTGGRMSLIDRKARRIVHVDYDDNFEHFILYSPDGSDFVCIEPWTRGLGAYEKLKSPGWETAGYLPVIQPGESMNVEAQYSVERM